MPFSSTQHNNFLAQKRALLDQKAADFVAAASVDTAWLTEVRDMLDKWATSGASSLDSYSGAANVRLRALAAFAVQYVVLEAMEHMVQDKEAESEATE